jgi:hypothetical protein
VALKRIKQETFEIARNALMRERWRRHHHGDTIDELPVLFIGPAFHEAAKQLD